MTNVKNYVICAHRRIKSTKWIWKDTKDEGEKAKLFDKLKELNRL